MRNKLVRKLVILLVVAAVVALIFWPSNGVENYRHKYAGVDLEQDVEEFSRANTYKGYTNQNADVKAGEQEIVPADFTDFVGDGRKVQVKTGEEIIDGILSVDTVPEAEKKTRDKNRISWKFNVPEDGMYSIRLDYVTAQYYTKEAVEGEFYQQDPATGEYWLMIPDAEGNTAFGFEPSEEEKKNFVASRGVDIERAVEINGVSPFDGAKTIRFTRQWKDAGEVRTDSQGNQIRPSQVEHFTAQTAYCRDDRGYVVEPYKFFFQKGENTLTLVAENEFVIITGIALVPNTEFQTYEQYLSAQPEDAQPLNDKIITIEGEDSTVRSSPSLYARYDRSSPATYPNDVKHTVLNYIGGDPWNQAGQWIEWEFNVPEGEAGYYNITIKGRQMYSRGSISCRTLYLDDQVPFEDVSSIAFKYNTVWDLMTLSDENGTPYRFYLTEGPHTIRLEATLGDMGSVLSEMEDSIYRLNQIYRTVLLLTGPNPDRYRDYNIKAIYPEVIKGLNLESKRLYKLVDDTVALTGQMNDRVAVAHTLALQMENFVKNNDRITQQFANFKDNITSFGTAQQNMAETKLDVDQIFIHSSDVTPQSNDDNALTRAWHEIKACAASYTVDYNNLGDVHDEDAENLIEVWIVTGRDQSTVLKTMVDDTFTPMTRDNGKEILVNVKLVQADAILTAVVAGNGPDIVLTVDGWFAVNYAMRNAVEDLTQFPDFDEVVGRVKNEDGTYNYDDANFYESALQPLMYNDGEYTGVYGLPETQIFSLLFYRKDVLEEMGLEVPQTWDDLIAILPTIQGNNMSVGIPFPDINSVDMSGFNSLIYQNGGTIYDEDAKRTLIDSEAGVKAFKLYTSFYNDYGLPTVYDFVSRFRSGEMPVAVGQYSLYNTLAVSAPEIRGLWDFTLYPGTLKEDGTIDRTVHSNGACCLMIATDDENVKQNAWEFMKWWVSADTQVRFGREMESILGSSARYATANRKALDQLPWSNDQLNVLKTQMAMTRGFPEIAGGYSTTRHMTNAIRKVINEKEDPREVLMNYTRTINEEITIKREQLGLPVDK